MKNIYLSINFLPCLLILSISIASASGFKSGLDDVESTFSGSVGDGPIVDATVMIYDKNHNLIKTETGKDNATYFTRIRARRKHYPLTIEVEDGFDLVTEMAPDFKLLSVTLNSRIRNTNVNPFSTMIVEAARTASGELSKESISTARALVMSQMNFGLDPLMVADPISTRITESNVAAMTKSSEAMGEMIRRVRDRMIISGADIDGNDVMAALAADISDGIINGVGGNLANPRIAALSKLVSAQVLIEALSNNLKVLGEVATSRLDTAILNTHPSVSGEQLTNSVTINSEMLEQLRKALYAAQILDPSSELSLLSDTLNSIPANSLPSRIERILPGDSGKYLETAITYALSATDEELKLVNNADTTKKLFKSAYTTAQLSNTAPTISGSPSSTAAEDSIYTFQPNAYDADGNALTFSISNRPAWASFDPNSGRLTGTPVNENVGVYPSITISVSDGSASASIGTFSITVKNTNDAPVISGSAITLVDENSPYNFQPSASDPDGDNLAFSISGKPSWAIFNNSTGQLSGTPGGSDANTYSNILISVSDGTASSSLTAFSIIVNNINTAPTINGSASTTANEDSIYLFQPNAYDADGDTLAFSISNLPAWASFDPKSGRLTGTPVNENVGVYPSITISVSDGSASTSTGAFSITVKNTNDAPVISGSAITLVDENSPYNFQPSASDPDGDNLVFSISGRPSWATFNNSTGQLSGIPGASDANTYSNILISVSDGTASDSLTAFSIIVNNINTPPTISGSPSTTATEDSSYIFQPDAFDADGDALTYSISNRPAWTSFDPNSGRLTGAPANEDEGTYPSITISVSDGSVSASIEAFSITVNSTNSAPIISGSPMLHVEENSLYSFQPSSGDPDGDNLVFSITGQPFWANFDSSNGRLSGTPSDRDTGIYSNIIISVSDGSLTTALPIFSVQVDATQVQAQTSTGSFTLNWTEPTNRVDNTPLFPTEIDSYTIHYGTSPGYYSNSIDVAYTEQTLTVTDLPADTYYAVLVTKDIDGRESIYSQEIVLDVQ